MLHIRRQTRLLGRVHGGCPMRISAFLAWSFLLLSSFLWPLRAQAAEGYDNCTGFIDSLPATIHQEGVWCLRKDLGTAITIGQAIYVGGNNITIDCNGYKLGGLGAGAATQATGIFSYTVANLSIRRCNIRGFMTGMLVSGQNMGSHVIEDNRLEKNTRYGIIVMGGKGAMIRRNIILDTGGSTWSRGDACAIDAGSGVNVVDNTISGVAAIADDNGNASAYGIFTSYNADGVVQRNRIRGLVPRGEGASFGIISNLSNPTSLRDNDLSGMGIPNSFGLYCSNSPAIAVGNVISGFSTPIFGCSATGNTVNTN